MSNDYLSGWEPVIPLEERAYETIPFPITALGPFLAEFCYQVAASIQVDVAMVCVALLGILAGCVQKKYVSDLHREALSLYMLIIASSGERKSPVLRVLQAPLNDFARERNMRCFFVTDATAEALENELIEHGGNTMVLSSEGGILDIVCGRYSTKGAGNLDVWLKAHDGDPINTKRVTRQTKPIIAPALSTVIMDQPCVINNVLANETLITRGFCARLLPCVVQDHVGVRAFHAPDISSDLRSQYNVLIKRLLEVPIPENPDNAICVPFCEDALSILEAEHILAEEWIQNGADGIVAWANKYMGLVVRICCILSIAEAIAVGDLPTVYAEQARRAIDIAHYFRAQAVSVFSVAREYNNDDISHRMLDYLRYNRDPIKKIDLFRAMRGQGVVHPADIDPALMQLERHNYLRIVPQEKATPGRPSSPMIMINPHAFD